MKKQVITFQLSADDKTALEQKAKSLKMSLSSFVRERAMMNNNRLEQILADNKRLKEENRKLQVQYGLEISDKDTKSLILRFTREQMKLMIEFWTGFNIPDFMDAVKMEEGIFIKVKDEIFEAIKDALINYAVKKYPDEGYDSYIEEIFEELADD